MSLVTNNLVKATDDHEVDDAGVAVADLMLVPPGIESVSFLRRYKAQDLVDAGGVDGAAVATVTDKSGSGVPAVQATTAAKPTLKTGIVNGKAVFRFDGGDYLTVASGGQSMTGAWYMAAVAKIGSVSAYQHLLCFGLDEDGKRRGMLLRDDSDRISFNGKSADIDPGDGPAEVVGNIVYYELRCDGTNVSVFRNGVLLLSGPPAIVSFTGGVLTIGANNAFGEMFVGDIAEVFFLDSAATASQRGVILGYVADEYDIAVTVPSPLLANSGGGATVNTAVTDDGTTVRVDEPVEVGSPGLPVAARLLSVFGGLLAKTAAGVNPHRLENNASGQNVLVVRNSHPAGYSAITYYDALDAEGGAGGVANAGQAPFAGSIPTKFIECSATGVPGELRIVQTNLSTGAKLRGALLSATQDWEFYLPGGELCFQMDSLGNVAIGAAAIATTATDGFLYIPSCAGTPTGMPTTKTGRTPVVYDSTNDILYVYRGGWKKATANIITGVVTWQ